MDQFFQDLSSLDRETKIIFLNRCSTHIKKQEIILKLWMMLNLENKSMCNQIFFCGLDKGLIAKEEVLDRRLKFLRLEDCCESRDLPEKNDNCYLTIPDVYKRNDFEIFRIIRRCHPRRKIEKYLN